jgi:hypothetical protein
MKFSKNDQKRMGEMTIEEAMSEFLPENHTLEDRIFVLKTWEAVKQEKHGWSAHSVFYEMKDRPEKKGIPYQWNHHTHGVVERFDHPDLQIVLPLAPAIVGSIFNTMVEIIKEGGCYILTNKEYEGVLGGGFKVRTRWATEGRRQVLRVILPDSQGNLAEDKIHRDYRDQYLGTI